MKEHYVIELIYLYKPSKALVIVDSPEAVVEWSRKNAGKITEPYFTMQAYQVTLH